MERRNGNVIIRRGGKTEKTKTQTAEQSFCYRTAKPQFSAAEARRRIDELRSLGATPHSECGGTFRCH